MGLNDYLDDFCKQHGYTYSLDYNKEKKEYMLTLGNEKQSGTFTMSREELQGLSNTQIKNMVKFLHEGIQVIANSKE